MKIIHHSLIVWEQEDLYYLNTHYLTTPSDEMAKHLGVSKTTVLVKMRELGLSSNFTRRVEWSADQLAYLIEHYPDEPACDIAQHLGISAQVVKKKADQMELKKSASYRKSAYTGRYVSKYKHREKHVEQSVL